MTTDPRDGDGRTSVVIISRNRPDELLHTLGRLAALPERPPVFVVDNADPHSGADEAAVPAAEAARRCPGVVVLRAGTNLGAVGRNLAARSVTTPYLAFCDDDTWWEPGSLAGAADLLDAHHAVAAVTARILVTHPLTEHHADGAGARPPGEQPAAGEDDSRAGPGTGEDGSRPAGGDGEDDVREDPVVAELRASPIPAPPWLPGPALGSFLAGATVLRTTAFREVGGFSPRLRFGGEEELLALDLQARGWWLVFADHLTIHHAPSEARDATGRRADGIRNTLWTTWLRRPAAPALRRTGHLLRTVPRDATSARAVARALGGLPWLLRERRVLPPEVEERLKPLDAAQRSSRARRYVG